MGKVLKGIGKVVGKVAGVAAPFAGLIPGVGPLAAAGLGAGSKLLSRTLMGKNTFGKGGFADIAGAGLAGGLGKFGIDKLGGTGNVFSKIGNVIRQPNMLGTPEGKLSLGKVIGLGTGAANFLGAQKQRKSAEQYLGAQTDLRNQLMSRVLSGGGQTYNFAPEP